MAGDRAGAAISGIVPHMSFKPVGEFSSSDL